jgi:ribose/xylose/arabinose/galactoside ABC-type transport system permease subunit
LKIQPFVATLILMVAGRGVAQLITSGQIVTLTRQIWPGLVAVSSPVPDAGHHCTGHTGYLLAVYP